MIVRVPKYKRACSEAEKQLLIEAARKYIGTPWVHMGRTAQGLDCAGLLIAVTYDMTRAWVEVSEYSPWPNQFVMRDICNRIMLSINREDIMPGDAALLYAPGLGVVHLGWYTGRTLIHASNEAHVRKVVETRIHPDWLLRGAFAVPRYEVE